MRAALVLAVVLAAAPATAATITVVNNDGAGEGFNDTTAVAAVGGNSGTTLGAQRLNAFTYAANIWGAQLTSNVTIKVDATMDPLTCSASSAVLGSAGANTVHLNFTNAPYANTYYPQALANKIAGTDLDGVDDDIVAEFNSSIGTTCSFPNVWYYGLDSNPGASKIDFVTVVLHELGHGLGFQTYVTLSSGSRLNSHDDVFMKFLEDHSLGLTWPSLTDAQRAASAIDNTDLHWVGSSVISNSTFLTAGRSASGHVQMYAPSTLVNGSSVSHWDTALTPNELMEPVYTTAMNDPSLARDLMSDIGWDFATTTSTSTSSTTSTSSSSTSTSSSSSTTTTHSTTTSTTHSTTTSTSSSTTSSTSTSSTSSTSTSSSSSTSTSSSSSSSTSTSSTSTSTSSSTTTTVPVACTGTPQTFSNPASTALADDGLTTSTIVVSGLGPYLIDANVQTFLVHPNPDDLDVTITSPSGTVVTLTTDNGGANANVFDGTVWDDSANPGGQVPYFSNDGMVTAQSYASGVVVPKLTPEEALGAFIGEDPNGTWTLRVSDDTAGNVGSLNGWSLILTALPQAIPTSTTSFANSTPVTVPTGPAVVSSQLTVSGVSTFLVDLDVYTVLPHTYSSDLEVTLTSPTGTVVTLTHDNAPGVNDAFDGTLWNDGANPGGQVPYTSNDGLVTDRAWAPSGAAPTLVPEEALAAFVGEDPNGTWTLTVADDQPADGGSLDQWRLDVRTGACLPTTTSTSTSTSTSSSTMPSTTTSSTSTSSTSTSSSSSSSSTSHTTTTAPASTTSSSSSSTSTSHTTTTHSTSTTSTPTTSSTSPTSSTAAPASTTSTSLAASSTTSTTTSTSLAATSTTSSTATSTSMPPPTTTLPPPTTTTVPGSSTTLRPATTTSTSTSTTTSTSPGVSAPLCPPVPPAGCRASASQRSALVLRAGATPAKHLLKWKIARGGQAAPPDLRDPVGGSAAFGLCVYDASASAQPVLAGAVTAGGTCGTKPCWKAVAGGYRYKNKAATVDGVTDLKLRLTAAGELQVLVKGRGAALPLPPLGLATPVRVDLVIDDGAGRTCWQSTFPSALENGAAGFRASGS